MGEIPAPRKPDQVGRPAPSHPTDAESVSRSDTGPVEQLDQFEHGEPIEDWDDLSRKIIDARNLIANTLPGGAEQTPQLDKYLQLLDSKSHVLTAPTAPKLDTSSHESEYATKLNQVLVGLGSLLQNPGYDSTLVDIAITDPDATVYKQATDTLLEIIGATQRVGAKHAAGAVEAYDTQIPGLTFTLRLTESTPNQPSHYQVITEITDSGTSA